MTTGTELRAGIELRTEKGTVRVSEAKFLDAPLTPNSYALLDVNSDEDWPGLEKTLRFALDRAKELIGE